MTVAVEALRQLELDLLQPATRGDRTAIECLLASRTADQLRRGASIISVSSPSPTTPRS